MLQDILALLSLEDDLQVLVRSMNADRTQKLLPSLHVGRMTVHDHAVQVKHKCFQHRQLRGPSPELAAKARGAAEISSRSITGSSMSTREPPKSNAKCISLIFSAAKA